MISLSACSKSGRVQQAIKKTATVASNSQKTTKLTNEDWFCPTHDFQMLSQFWFFWTPKP